MKAVLVSPTVQEAVLAFDIAGSASLGILAEPTGTPAEVAVLMVVGGPQYRAGAHRHFVLLARTLAEAGFSSVRFDHRGLGDCVAPLRSFEALEEDVDAAVHALLQARPGLQGVVIWGLCDAAAAALLYCARRPAKAVRGLVLLNPWVRSAQTEAATRVRHYYWERLRDPAFWRKLVGGGVGLGALKGWWQARRLATAPIASGAYQDVMARGWQRTALGPILLQLCPDDFTAQEFLHSAGQRPSWANWLQRAGLTRHDYLGADHTYSDPQHLRQSMADTVSWLRLNFSKEACP